MRQALLIIDVQPSFAPPQWLIEGIQTLIGTLPSVATVERHDDALVQRFPVYDSTDADSGRTGKMRQVQYTLIPGAAGWILRAFGTTEY